MPRHAIHELYRTCVGVLVHTQSALLRQDQCNENRQARVVHQAALDIARSDWCSMPPAASGLIVDAPVAKFLKSRQNLLVTRSQVILAQQNALITELPIDVPTCVSSVLSECSKRSDMSPDIGKVLFVTRRKKKKAREATSQVVPNRATTSKAIGTIVSLRAGYILGVGLDDSGRLWAVCGPVYSISSKNRKFDTHLVGLAISPHSEKQCTTG